MHVIAIPAQYQRHLVALLERAAAEIERDQALRSDEDERVRAFAPVPDEVLDAEASGQVAIVVVQLPQLAVVQPAVSAVA